MHALERLRAVTPLHQKPLILRMVSETSPFVGRTEDMAGQTQARLANTHTSTYSAVFRYAHRNAFTFHLAMHLIL